jgi:BlaI family penicillinase repressor
MIRKERSRWQSRPGWGRCSFRSCRFCGSRGQTLLRQLEAKGAVAHDIEERTFLYRPLVQPSEVTETPLHDLLMRVYQGSVVNLMSHLLKHETVSQDELTRLRRMLEEEREK